MLKNPDKIRAVVELLKQRRRGGKSAAERKHESLVRHGYNSIERREPADPKRRKRLEGKPEAWLRGYFPNVFTLPFADGHRAIIRRHRRKKEQKVLEAYIRSQEHETENKKTDENP